MAAILQLSGLIKPHDNLAFNRLCDSFRHELAGTGGFVGLRELRQTRQPRFQWLLEFRDGPSLQAFLPVLERWLPELAGGFDLAPVLLSQRLQHDRTQTRPLALAQLAGQLRSPQDGRAFAARLQTLREALSRYPGYCGSDWLLDPDQGHSQLLTWWSDTDDLMRCLEDNQGGFVNDFLQHNSGPQAAHIFAVAA